MTQTEVEDAIGKAIDQVETLFSGLVLEVPWELQRQGLRHSLLQLRDGLRRVYFDLSGDDPWGTAPLLPGEEDMGDWE